MHSRFENIYVKQFLFKIKLLGRFLFQTYLPASNHPYTKNNKYYNKGVSSDAWNISLTVQ